MVWFPKYPEVHEILQCVQLMSTSGLCLLGREGVLDTMLLTDPKELIV